MKPTKFRILSSWSLAGVFLLMLGLFGCYPNDDLSVSEFDIVATDYDSGYFTTKTPASYLMPDTVVQLGDPDPSNQLTRVQMDFILAQVASNFASLGYTRIDEATAQNMPDVVVTVSVVVSEFSGVGCIPWYPYWGWYPWYPSWGWGGGYCYPAYAYSYTTGTLLIDMVDPNQSVGDNFKRVWNVGINGLVRSSISGNQQFVTQTIDQAFKQSPYLN